MIKKGNPQTGEQGVNGEITLRPVLDSDLETFFEQQREPEGIFMAAFTAKDPEDRDAFSAHWEKIRSDESITLRTIMFKHQITGHIVCHSWFGDPEISYWIGKAFWGKGIATAALKVFLNEVTVRPLYGRAANDNIGSIRVLEKGGFKIAGADKGFANARGEEIEEVIYVLW